MVAFLLTSIALVWYLDPALHAAFPAGLLWRNALPVFLFFLLIYGLSGRALFSLVLGAGITRVIFKVNAIKQLNMGQPVLPGDLLLGDQVFHNAEFFAHYTGRHLVLLLLAALLFVAVLWVIWRAERHSLRLRWLPRLLWLLVSLVALVTLYRGDGAWQKVYADKALPGFHLWSPMASVKKVGFVAEFARMAQESRVRLPAGDQELVANFAEQHADDLRAATTRKPPAELPDIVVVQSEAFFDPGILKAVDPGEFVPNFERLAATGISGSLITPAYGGGTIRTEFETLTGYPMAAFPAISYPYFGLARQWMPTVPRRLEALGYSTVLFHPFLADFWNRKGVMPALGFQHAYYAEKFVDAKRAGIYVSDRSLFDFVLAHLDERATHPQYVLAITMENHGPWNADAGALTSVLSGKSLPTALSAKGRREMTYYLSHLVNGDRALGDFAKRLLARPRWTILIFYGDHLPAMPHAFARLGFDDDGPDIAQHTRYMLLSNRALTPHKLDFNAYDLPGLLFDVVGLPRMVISHWRLPFDALGRRTIISTGRNMVRSSSMPHSWKWRVGTSWMQRGNAEFGLRVRNPHRNLQLMAVEAVHYQVTLDAPIGTRRSQCRAMMNH